MLLFWPFFGLSFLFLERFRMVPHYHISYCRLDDFIPFNELFIFPYMFWFVYLIGTIAYTFFKDKQDFVRLMKYIIAANTMSLIIFVAFPTIQLLRPVVFPRDNVLTQFISAFYRFDTNTNVAPSLHVIDSVAVLTVICRSKRFAYRPIRIGFAVCCLLICASTVFLKQHSVIDLLVAIPVCYASEWIAYGEPLKKISAVRAGRIVR